MTQTQPSIRKQPLSKIKKPLPKDKKRLVEQEHLFLSSSLKLLELAQYFQKSLLLRYQRASPSTSLDKK